jgi:hypothetical protein
VLCVLCIWVGRCGQITQWWWWLGMDARSDTPTRSTSGSQKRCRHPKVTEPHKF